MLLIEFKNLLPAFYACWYLIYSLYLMLKYFI